MSNHITDAFNEHQVEIRRAEMNLKYIKIGTDCTKSPDGNGFSGKGGGWDLYKMFYDEDGYGEFYFNINTKTGEAEITNKDAGYAPVLMKALQGVLND